MQVLLRSNRTHMGMGVTYVEGSEYGWYWSQIFTNDLYGEVEYEGQYLPSNYEVVPADEGDINGDAIVNTFDYITLTEYPNGSDLYSPRIYLIITFASDSVIMPSLKQSAASSCASLR